MDAVAVQDAPEKAKGRKGPKGRKDEPAKDVCGRCGTELWAVAGRPGWVQCPQCRWEGRTIESLKKAAAGRIAKARAAANDRAAR